MEKKRQRKAWHTQQTIYIFLISQVNVAMSVFLLVYLSARSYENIDFY